MSRAEPFQRLAGVLAIVAGPLAWASLVVGLSVVDYDFERFSDPQAILNLGPAVAATIRWSFWLSMCGSYLFVIPVTMWLSSTLRIADQQIVRWYTLCGLSYLGLGAMGAALLAAVWPLLISLYATAAPEQQASVLISFTTATAIAEDGLQGVLQNVVGSVWLLGIGVLLWRRLRFLGGFTCLLGAMLAVTALGALLGSEALSLLGLSATILLAPLWSIWTGVLALRQPPHPHG